MSKLNDQALISQIKQGQKQAFQTLVERYYDDILRFCYYKTGNEAAAYDCTQTTFLNLVKFFDAYVERNQFKPYLFRIASNACIDYFRKNPNIFLEDTCLNQLSQIDQRLEQAETASLVQQAIQQLPDIQRDVVILRFYYDFKLKDIANITNVGLPTAKSRLKQGLAKLEQILREEGLYEAI